MAGAPTPLLARRLGARGAPWRVWQGSGPVLAEGPLSELGAALRAGVPPATVAAGLVLLAPSPDVRVASVELPGVSARQARAAAPFALEEGLAEDLDALLVSVTPLGGARHGVALLRRRRLAGWVGALRAGGLRVQRVVPAPLCLPWQAGDLGVAADGEMVHLRWAAWQALSVPWALLPALLASIAAAGEVRRLRLIAGGGTVGGSVGGSGVAGAGRAPGGPGAGTGSDRATGSGSADGAGSPPAELERLLQAQPALAALPRQHEDASLEAVLAEGLAGLEGELDLLSADGGAGAGWAALARTWRWPAALAAAVLVGLGLQIWQDTRLLRAERDRWDERARALYQEAFPEARRITDVERVVRQRLARSASGDAAADSSVLVLLAGALRSLQAVPALRLEALDYRAGRLELQLSAPALAPFEAWRSRLAELSPELRGETLSALATPEGASARVAVMAR